MTGNRADRYVYGYRTSADGRRVREYRGRVDPETGELGVPRRRVPRPSGPGHVSSRDLGNVLVLYEAARGLGLPEDLGEVFGEDAPWILALSMVQAIGTEPVSGSMHSLSRTCIADVLDLRFPSDGRIPIGCTATVSDVGRFFDLRSARCPGRYLVGVHVGPFGGPTMRPAVMGEGILRTESGSNVLVSLTPEGVPVSMLAMSGSPRDVETMCRFVSGARRAGEVTLILQSAFTDAGSLTRFLRLGVDTVATSTLLPPPVARIAERIGDRSLCTEGRTVDGHRCLYTRGRIGVMDGGTRVTYLDGSDPRLRDCTHILDVYPTLDTVVNRRGRSALDTRVSEVRSELEGLVSDDPDGDFRMVARDAVPYLRHTVRPDGTMHVSARHDVLDPMRRRVGMYVTITTGSDWDRAVGLLSMADDTLSDLGPPLDVLDDGDPSKGSDGHRFDRLLRLVSAMMLARVRGVLRSSGIPLEPRAALSMASGLRLVTIGDEEAVTDPDGAAEMVLRVFGIEL